MIQKKTEEIYFRPMTISDLSYVMEIENQSQSAPWSLEMFRKELHNQGSFFTVAVIKNKIAGYCASKLSFNRGHIMTFAIDPSHRRMGIGEALLCYKLNMMKNLGAKTIQLEVRVSNCGAQALYRKQGFKEIGVQEKYYPDNQESALVMMITLEKYRAYSSMTELLFN